MKSIPKYRNPERVNLENRQWPDKVISSSPEWCSVDLRDGNQALPMPMNPVKKLEYFNLLLSLGFKQIEVGFPSASQDDFDFIRSLIEKNCVPDGVRISVLTQARKHLIDKTVESLKGCKEGILHLYVASSDLHGRIVFGKDREGVKKMAVEGTKMVVEALEKAGLKGKIGYEFSPEEFTDSDIDFAIELCAAVKEAWGKSPKADFIVNLPATVERRPPYQYADMIEYFCRKYPYTAETTISVHAHNDQGCAVAATEMALMAGAERVEGTLFGHGERTGNVDICTLALNLQSRGIDTGLDFSDMPKVVKVVENMSGIDVHPRHPYAGQLVFTAFSGSHQDAIRKGIDHKDESAEIFGQAWKVPYLHIDPADLGRQYEKLIRINSQSGKGGVVYILEHEFGIFPPKGMHPEIGDIAQACAEKKGDEIGAAELEAAFRETFVNIKGPFSLLKFTRLNSNEDDESADDSEVKVRLSVKYNEEVYQLEGCGNGPISATVHAIRDSGKLYDFKLEDFSEKTLGNNADAKAMAFVGIRRKEDDKLIYGVGEHSNIDQAAIFAVFSAINRAAAAACK